MWMRCIAVTILVNCHTIIIGFTSGIDVTIFTTQIADIFGLSFGEEKVPGDFVGKWMIYFRHFDTVNWWNTIVSVVSIIIIDRKSVV